MTRILVENLNGLDLGGITTHIFNYIQSYSEAVIIKLI